MSMDANAPIRAFVGRVVRLITEEGKAALSEFRPKPDDVVVATPAKSGTTWMQMICHGLRTRGSLDFEEIDRVIPCIEYAFDYGYTDLDALQVASPRMFKTHLPYNQLPPFQRIVRVVRNPGDAAVSLYYFLLDWFFSAEEMSLDNFVSNFVLASSGIDNPLATFCPWTHIAEWYAHRKDPGILWIHYEDMHENLPAVVKLVAEFLDIGADDRELQDLVTKQARFDFMKKHKEKFDQRHLKLYRNEAVDLPKHAGLNSSNPGKVRAGRVGDHKEKASPKLLAAMDAKWAEIVEPVTGFSCYEDMRNSINAELGRPFGLLSKEQ